MRREVVYKRGADSLDAEWEYLDYLIYLGNVGGDYPHAFISFGNEDDEKRYIDGLEFMGASIITYKYIIEKPKKNMTIDENEMSIIRDCICELAETGKLNYVNIRMGFSDDAIELIDRIAKELSK